MPIVIKGHCWDLYIGACKRLANNTAMTACPCYRINIRLPLLVISVFDFLPLRSSCIILLGCTLPAWLFLKSDIEDADISKKNLLDTKYHETGTRVSRVVEKPINRWHGEWRTGVKSAIDYGGISQSFRKIRFLDC